MSILQADNLHKTFRMGEKVLRVLAGASLEVRAGEFVAIVGASGTGKSTLLHCLGLLDRPTSGEVLFEGRSISTARGRRQDDIRNRTFGFVFQLYHLLPEFNVVENALLPQMVSTSALAWPGRRRAARERAESLLGRLGLGERLKHRPSQLSGGEQQRVAIARALINDPPVLLCDEPTGNLDPHTGEHIIELLVDIRQAERKTMVMVTHDPHLAQRADRVLRLEEGLLRSMDG
jgi:lipoprotein-releasing system ATP-binding protein